MGVGTQYWIRKGFMLSEASAFKNITKEAIKDSRYISVMIETRMRRSREARQRGMDIRGFHQWVRKMYVRKGFAESAKASDFDGVKGRRLAFAFFNAYKDKYAVRDNTGKIIETPRKKARVSKKPITGKRSIDQMIRKYREQIKDYQWKLKFERNDYMRQSYQRRINNLKRGIINLRHQSTA